MKYGQLTVSRPESNEYAPYYDKYVSLVPEGDILVTLDKQSPETSALLARPESEGDFRYAPGKWSVKESLGHVIDAERVFSYRALRIARKGLRMFQQVNVPILGIILALAVVRPIPSATAVDQLLLPRVEGMAVRADVRADLAHRRARQRSSGARPALPRWP